MNLTRDSDSAFLNKPLKNSNKDKCFWGSHLFKTPREKRLHICATHSTFSHGSQSNHWITHEISLATTTFLYTDVTNWNSLPVHLKMLEFHSLFKVKLYFLLHYWFYTYLTQPCFVIKCPIYEYNTVQWNIIQHKTIQYNAIKYNMILYQ